MPQSPEVEVALISTVAHRLNDGRSWVRGIWVPSDSHGIVGAFRSMVGAHCSSLMVDADRRLAEGHPPAWLIYDDEADDDQPFNVVATAFAKAFCTFDRDETIVGTALVVGALVIGGVTQPISRDIIEALAEVDRTCADDPAFPDVT